MGRHFRCDIKGLGAESVKLNEEFSPNCRRDGERPVGNPIALALTRLHRRQALMTRPTPFARFSRQVIHTACLGVLMGAGVFAAGPASAVDLPITSQQRGTAQKVAEAGVPLSELAPNAPDSYKVKRGDTLWDISKLFLKSPWRWPELWGMNLDQIRNPHLIYPGQMLFLDKSGGRARLRLGQPVGDTDIEKRIPRTREESLGNGAIPSIPFNLIEPFLNEAVIFQTNELETAPRIVATQENRVLLSKGDTAYVGGELGADTAYRIFRNPKPLHDPGTREILGYEAEYVGTADFTRQGGSSTGPDGKTEITPATFIITTVRQEGNIGDRLSPVPKREFENYAPHAPQGSMSGQIASVYGEAIYVGQNQIVALNRGARDGMERGHILALWRDGARIVDKTDASRPTMKLPDERHGTMFVFRVFDRMSYALILSVQEPVKTGDRFTQP
jgi:hypothetical protein